MKIKTLIENEEGMYEFQAELTQEQHQFLIEYAIRDLIVKGLLPFASGGEHGTAHIVAPSEVQQ